MRTIRVKIAIITKLESTIRGKIAIITIITIERTIRGKIAIITIITIIERTPSMTK